MLGGYVDEVAGIPLIQACLDNGINFIDTADIYGGGRSEEIIGKAIKGRRQEAIVTTKIGGPIGKGPNERGSSRKHLIDGIEASLKRLQTDYIDVYLIHFWDPETPLDETLSTLDQAVKQGKIRYIGCSNHSAWQLCKALWVSDKLGLERFEVVQPVYNFMDRSIEKELLPLCQDQNVAVTPYQILMGGMFTGKYQPDQPPPAGSRIAARPAMKERMFKESIFGAAREVEKIGAASGLTPTQVVIGWALASLAITSVIVGASRIEQVKANARPEEIKLSKEQIDACNKLM